MVLRYVHREGVIAGQKILLSRCTGDTVLIPNRVYVSRKPVTRAGPGAVAGCSRSPVLLV